MSHEVIRTDANMRHIYEIINSKRKTQKSKLYLKTKSFKVENSNL